MRKSRLRKKKVTLRMGEEKESDGPIGLQLRSYQLEMLEENMHTNIIVAVCPGRSASVITR